MKSLSHNFSQYWEYSYKFFYPARNLHFLLIKKVFLPVFVEYLKADHAENNEEAYGQGLRPLLSQACFQISVMDLGII